MKTNNSIANYIATKEVAKHMDRTSALHVWNDLKAEGWTKDGCKLVSHAGEFRFAKQAGKMVVSYHASPAPIEDTPMDQWPKDNAYGPIPELADELYARDL